MEASEMVDLISRLGSDSNVPARVKTLREAHGWSLQELSDELAKPPIGYQINKSSLWKIESGSPPRQVSFREATAFARVFNVPLEDLYLTDGQLAQRELASAVSMALRAFAAAQDAWMAYAQSVSYAQSILERVDDADRARESLATTRRSLAQRWQRKVMTLWRNAAAHRIERGERLAPELMMDDKVILASEEFARFLRVLSEQPSEHVIDDILAGDTLAADALLPESARKLGGA